MVAWTLQKVRLVVVTVVGFAVVCFGIAMIPLPAPGVLVIPVGLGILATEFVWAQRLLTKAKGLASRARTGAGPLSGKETVDG